MARISGIDIPDHKRVDIALTKLYGIGRSNVKKLLLEAKLDGAKRAKDLTEAEINTIQKLLEGAYIIEGDLRRQIADNVKRLKQMGAYRGVRHIRGLPVRGQRTRSNARTRRGKRQTVGALRKETRAKLEQPGTKAAETK